MRLKYKYTTANGKVEGWTYDNYAGWVDELYREVGMLHPAHPAGDPWWKLCREMGEIQPMLS